MFCVSRLNFLAILFRTLFLRVSFPVACLGCLSYQMKKCLKKKRKATKLNALAFFYEGFLSSPKLILSVGSWGIAEFLWQQPHQWHSVASAMVVSHPMCRNGLEFLHLCICCEGVVMMLCARMTSETILSWGHVDACTMPGDSGGLF